MSTLDPRLRLPRVPSTTLLHSRPSVLSPHSPTSAPAHPQPAQSMQSHTHGHKHSLSLNSLNLPGHTANGNPALPADDRKPMPTTTTTTTATNSALSSPSRRRGKPRPPPAPIPSPGPGTLTPLLRPSTPQPQRPTHSHSRVSSLDQRPPPAPAPPVRRRSVPSPAEPAAFPSWDWPHLPLTFALLPVVTSVLFGRGEVVADLFYVLLLWWYLSFLTHSPWELYTASLHTSSQEQQLLLLSLTLAAPLLGGALLALVSRSLTFLPPLPSFSIRLFILAASIRPVKHLLRLWQGSLDLPEPEYEQERDQQLSQLQSTEQQLAQSKELADLRSQVERLGQEVLRARAEQQAVVKAVKRQERKAELYRLGMLKPAPAQPASDAAGKELQQHQPQQRQQEQGWTLTIASVLWAPLFLPGRVLRAATELPAGVRWAWGEMMGTVMGVTWGVLWRVGGWVGLR